MAQEFVTIHMKNRKVNVIPKANLANFKRIFFAQIDYIEEQEGEPIIAKPIIQEIKTPIAQPIVESVGESPKASTTMSKKELQDLAKSIDGYKSSMSKKQLVDLINE
jgi:hypothetical protein